ncbi:MAG: Crp/Fnr family transcriptional regulator [Planctomycetaceae bacterium]|nr:Crp/Fnr family transcriptional regulator [Planctomycetaceae bacterium]
MLQLSENRILARLSDAEHEQLAPRFDRVALTRSFVIAEPGMTLEFAYFPVGCVLSSLIVFENGMTVETATAGNEGMVYAGLSLRPQHMPYRIIPQIAGECLRIAAEELLRSIREIPRLGALLQRYCLSLLLETSQNAACNLRHTVEQRMARWLLLCADRSGKDEFELTQEFLAMMLGVRRQSVNVTAGLLNDRRLIDYRRGGIKVLDRAGLTSAACECYRAISRLYDAEPTA